ncbi:MAG TPA: TolC family protein [Candidatus Acidoferrum sp.]|nr:TolC family protein [Candidatus Acidoferrum sp.]
MPLRAFAQGQTLTLNDAINLAETHNRALQVAKLDQRKAADEASVARSYRLPSFSSTALGSQPFSQLGLTFPRGSLGTYPNVGPIPGKTTTLRGPLKLSGIFFANITQPLAQQWKIGLQAQFASVGQRISEQQVRATRQATVNDVRRLYYGILQAESGKKNLQATVEFLSELDRNTKQDELQRVALHADVLNVQAQLAQAEYDLLKLEDPLETQKQQLNRLMGRDVNTPFEVDPLSVADAAVPDPQEACARALASRPEILQARSRVEQAKLGRKIANADRIPDIGLSATAVETVNLSNILPNSFVSAGIQMNWDVFDWGRKRKKVEEARLSEEQASLQLKDAEAAVIIDVTHRYRELAEAKKEVEVATRLQTAAKESVRVTRNQYMQKAALTSDLLKAESGLAEAAHRVTGALLDLATTQADLEKAIGEDP